jgi:hypothetical protein
MCRCFGDRERKREKERERERQREIYSALVVLAFLKEIETVSV